MSELKDFKAEIERFLVDNDMPPTVFGQKALADPNFVFDLRAGRDVRFSTVEKIRAFMRKQRQKKADNQRGVSAA
jgi:homoserine dehydrogenase